MVWFPENPSLQGLEVVAPLLCHLLRAEVALPGAPDLVAKPSHCLVAER